MGDPIERRALLALYRNHPATQPGERYKWKAMAAAREQRGVLLAWAATKPDEELLWCHNLGPVALRWIRANQPTAAYDDDGVLRPEASPLDHRLRCIDCGQEVGPGMVPCPTPGKSMSVRESLKRLGMPQEKGRIPSGVIRPSAFAEDWSDPASPFADLEAENADLRTRLDRHHSDPNVPTCEVCD